MNIKGKILGAGIGTLLLGPVGAAIGAAIGAVIDEGDEEKEKRKAEDAKAEGEFSEDSYGGYYGRNSSTCGHGIDAITCNVCRDK